MKNVYVVLDNDREDSVVTINTYSTYEKAEKAVKEAIQELKDQYEEQYEEIEEHNHDWLFIDGDDIKRVIELSASEVK